MRRYPAALFHAPFRGNLFHYLLDGALALFPTLDARGLLDNFEVLRDNLTDTDQARSCWPTSTLSGPMETISYRDLWRSHRIGARANCVVP